MMATRPDRLTAHVVRVVTAARERAARDWRHVRMRRPIGWSREDFTTFHVLHHQRGDWTYVLERDGDVAVIVVGDRLLMEGADAAT